MIRSMTGYGHGEAECGGRILQAEIRTVNHRFLEISARLPRGFQALEGRLRSHLQEKLSRGKVNLTVSWKGAGESGVLQMDDGLAERYFELLQELRARFEFREPVTLAHLLGHPELFKWDEPEVEEAESWGALTGAVDAAVEGLMAMREAEGGALARDLLARIQVLRETLKVVEARSPERAREAKEKLHARVEELLQGEAKVDPDRLLIEAALQADRMDCTEECVRLVSHFDQFEQLFADGGAAGRKLNFLLQEMNREANTIGSKANDSTIAREVIGIKEEIEILREQIQNIE